MQKYIEQYLAISKTFSVLYCVFYSNVENEDLERALWVKNYLHKCEDMLRSPSLV